MHNGLSNFKKEELNSSKLSNVFGGQNDGDPCCSFTIYSDGSTSDSDEDCDGTVRNVAVAKAQLASA